MKRHSFEQEIFLFHKKMNFKVPKRLILAAQRILNDTPSPAKYINSQESYISILIKIYFFLVLWPMAWNFNILPVKKIICKVFLQLENPGESLVRKTTKRRRWKICWPFISFHFYFEGKYGNGVFHREIWVRSFSPKYIFYFFYLLFIFQYFLSWKSP